MSRVVFHVDIDAFFASVEQVLDPRLAGRPVIVGGRPDDRSVVASASYEARARGVKTGMPIAKAYRLVPDGVFLRGTFANYDRASRQVFETCSQFSPVVEPASIDEGYLDMTGTQRLWAGCTRLCGPAAKQLAHNSGWAMRAATALRDRVLAETGLHVSIGIGTSRLIARVATDLAKPNGVCLVPPGCEYEFLSPMPAGTIPGIGPRSAERLAQAGIRTIADLRSAAGNRLVRALAESVGLIADRRADSGSEVRAGRRPPRSISRESSFELDEPDRGAVLAMLYYLVERAVWALRRERLNCRCVCVKLRYADFTTRTSSQSLPVPADQQGPIFAAARDLLAGLDTRRLPVRLIGVCVDRLTAAGDWQMGLFDEPVSQRRRRLAIAQDAIRDRFGFSSLVTGQAIELISRYEQDANGFKLRTNCLTK